MALHSGYQTHGHRARGAAQRDGETHVLVVGTLTQGEFALSDARCGMADEQIAEKVCGIAGERFLRRRVTRSEASQGIVQVVPATMCGQLAGVLRLRRQKMQRVTGWPRLPAEMESHPIHISPAFVFPLAFLYLQRRRCFFGHSFEEIALPAEVGKGPVKVDFDQIAGFEFVCGRWRHKTTHHWEVSWNFQRRLPCQHLRADHDKTSDNCGGRLCRESCRRMVKTARVSFPSFCNDLSNNSPVQSRAWYTYWLGLTCCEFSVGISLSDSACLSMGFFPQRLNRAVAQGNEF